MTCRDDVGTTRPDKSESKRYILVPNCFLGLAMCRAFLLLFLRLGAFFAIRQEKMSGEVVGEGVGEKGMSGSRKSILIY